MDEQLILDTADAAAPALRALAREILAAEARHRGVSLEAADVLPRRTEGAPAGHITAAADQLLEHLAAAEGIIVPEQGIGAVLARAGAQLLMSGIELDDGRRQRERGVGHENAPGRSGPEILLEFGSSDVRPGPSVDSCMGRYVADAEFIG